MINSISLKNFKSFIDTKDIKFSPLTIISGANSSGKSSLIQSILLIKQTLESTVLDEPLLLNGSYVSLGEISDVINFNSKNNDFNFKIQFKNGNEQQSSQELKGYYQMLTELINSLGVSIEGVALQNDQKCLTKLEKVKFFWEANNSKFQVGLKHSVKLNESLEKNFNYNQENLKDSLLFEFEKPKGFNFNVTPEAILLNTFIPETFFFPHHEKYIQLQNDIIVQFINLITGIFGSEKRPTRFNGRMLTRLFNNELRNITRIKKVVPEKTLDDNQIYDLTSKIKKIFTSSNKRDLQDFNVDESLGFFINYFPEVYLQKITEFLDQSIDELMITEQEKKSLVSRRARSINFISPDSEQSFDFDDILTYLKNRFNKIYYLGPLREEPHAIYNRFPTHDTTYVGQKGENVAFVLKHYSSKVITAVLPPEGNEEFSLGNVNVTEVSLKIAVQKWLIYLGIAKEINVHAMGKFGLTIQVDVFDGKSVDLTNVGVGVSQILPIVVLGLLAPQDESVLIFEQPELHLHPYIQSRIGDFFMAMTYIGKQVIAETHSEHLINRIRYHIATGNIKYDKDALVYFVERANDSPQSKIKRVDIDKFGSILQYPEGFFDETEKQLQAILDAAFKREDLFE